MNYPKDFQDAESVRSGNSHVASQPGVFPKHPHFEVLLRLYSYRSDKLMGRQVLGVHPVYQETFLHIHKLPLQLRIFKD